MSTWEERMSAKAKARMAARQAVEDAETEAAAVRLAERARTATPQERAASEELDPFPGQLMADLPDGAKDVARWWCTRCGLPDAPRGGKFEPEPPCPRCGSRWRWHGRVCDLDGAATEPPGDQCLECYEWSRHSPDRFGWVWWRRCNDGSGKCRFDHRHHDDEIWLA